MAKKTSGKRSWDKSKTATVQEWLFSARFDPWVQYRLSMLVMLVLLAWSWGRLWQPTSPYLIESFSVFAFLQALINWPHFIVSYKVLYLDHRDWRKYKVAMLHVPLGLAAAWLLAAYWAWTDQLIFANNFSYLVWMLAAFYLAWHYVGQSWGLVALGLLQAGCTISKRERDVLSGSLKVMIVWHLVWAMQQVGSVPVLVELKSPMLMTLANYSAITSAFVVALVLARLYLRHKHLPEKIWAPLVLLYLWYLVLWTEPTYALFIQLSHALQYLIFPAKIQMARMAEERQTGHDLLASATWPWVRLVATYLSCALIGWLVFVGPIRWWDDHPTVVILAGLTASLVNIHHYFTDGAVWKLRDARVRNLLLAPLHSKDSDLKARGLNAEGASKNLDQSTTSKKLRGH